MSRVAIAVSLFALAAGALSLALTGCGSSAPSMSTLRRQATRICVAALARSDRIEPPVLPSGTATFLRRGAAVLEPELAELRKLHPPAIDAGAYDAALAAVSRQLKIIDGTVRALDDGADPLSVIKTLQHEFAPTESAEDAAWRTLDVLACASR